MMKDKQRERTKLIIQYLIKLFHISLVKYTTSKHNNTTTKLSYTVVLTPQQADFEIRPDAKIKSKEALYCGNRVTQNYHQLIK